MPAIGIKDTLTSLLERHQERKIRQLADVNHHEGLSPHLDHSDDVNPCLNPAPFQLLNPVTSVPLFTDSESTVRAGLLHRAKLIRIILKNRRLFWPQFYGERRL